VSEVEGETESGNVLVQGGTDVDRTLRDWLRMWVGMGHINNETVPPELETALLRQPSANGLGLGLKKQLDLFPRVSTARAAVPCHVQRAFFFFLFI
jgi:hypothetical protein